MQKPRPSASTRLPPQNKSPQEKERYAHGDIRLHFAALCLRHRGCSRMDRVRRHAKRIQAEFSGAAQGNRDHLDLANELQPLCARVQHGEGPRTLLPDSRRLQRTRATGHRTFQDVSAGQRAVPSQRRSRHYWKQDERGAIVYATLKLRSEEHTSELQSPYDLVCRLLLEKKNEQ